MSLREEMSFSGHLRQTGDVAFCLLLRCFSHCARLHACTAQNSACQGSSLSSHAASHMLPHCNNVPTCRLPRNGNKCPAPDCQASHPTASCCHDSHGTCLSLSPVMPGAVPCYSRADPSCSEFRKSQLTGQLLLLVCLAWPRSPATVALPATP